MSPTKSVRSLGASALGAIALVAVLALAAGAVLGGGPGTSPVPSPSAPPSGSPKPSAPPSATPEPGKIRLDISTGHDVVVVIDDRTGKVVKATSGRAGDGMSVRWGDAKVETWESPNRVRLTWVGLPVDDEVELTVSTSADGYRFDIVQRGPYPNTDATGHDRVLVIEFDEAVDPADVEVEITYHQD